MAERPCKVTFRLSEEEKEHLNEQAKLVGMKLEPFLRALVMGSQLKAHPPEPWVDMVRQLSAIGNNINQIAHVANSTGQVRREELDSVIAMQADIWRAVKGL